jgi:hypothetical protein
MEDFDDLNPEPDEHGAVDMSQQARPHCGRVTAYLFIPFLKTINGKWSVLKFSLRATSKAVEEGRCSWNAGLLLFAGAHIS